MDHDGARKMLDLWRDMRDSLAWANECNERVEKDSGNTTLRLELDIARDVHSACVHAYFAVVRTWVPS